ncbi:MAG: PQQ-binding-like beta-propeller repeat protein [Myxococcales bacterium]|nr:PQQ-binding-like beta-propeller repeat protein [Myxococcales bacterium]
MTSGSFLALLLITSASVPTPWVLLSEPTPLTCPNALPLALQLETTHSIVLSQTASTGEALRNQIRHHGAHFGVETRPSMTNIGLVEVVLHTQEDSKKALGNTAYEALQKVWPTNGPPLAPALTLPERTSLQAACDGESVIVASLAQAALVPLLFYSVAIERPDNIPDNFLWKWARARALFTQGEYEQSLRDYQSVIQSLKTGSRGPIWRKLPTTSSTSPSALTLGKKGVYVFEEGTLAYLDFQNGHARWDRALGRIDATPNLLDNENPIFVINDNGAKALSSETGELLWEMDIPGAQPEVAIRGRRVFLAGSRELRAVDRTNGRQIWSRELSEDVIAGPVAINEYLAVPLGTGIRTFRIRSGQPLKDISTGDEVSSPLLLTPKGLIWLLVGSDEVVQLSPKHGKTLVRFHNLPGVVWPPLVLGEKLAITTQNSRRRNMQLQILDTRRAKRRRRVRTYGLVQPWSNRRGLVHITSKGLEVVSRNAQLQVQTRYRLPSPATALATFGSYAAIGLEDGLVVVNIRKQRSKGTRYRLEAPVNEVVMGPVGIATLLDNGVVYGWLSKKDPRLDTWLQLSQRDAGEAAYQAGLYDEAQRIAKAALQRAPTDWRTFELHARALNIQSPISSISPLLALHARLPTGSPPRIRAEAMLSDLGFILTEPQSLAPDSPLSSTSTTSTQLSSSSPHEQSSPTPSKNRPYLSLGFTVQHEITTTNFHIQAGTHRLVTSHRFTSKIRWRKRFPRETILHVATQGRNLLVWTSRRLRRIRIRDGRILDQLHFSRSIQYLVETTEPPLALSYDGFKLIIIKSSTVERLRAVSLPGVAALRKQANQILMDLKDGRTWRIDLARLSQLRK